MKNSLKKLLAFTTVSALTACGGGGGSSGTISSPYNITLRAAKTQLPLNVSGSPAGQGVYAPFTTTLYVDASMGGQPIPGGKDVFACNLSGGLDSGSLYYLDGDAAHEDENKIPLAYRSITLGANSGGNSFHFHAGRQAGTARITCTVTDPRDKQQRSTSVDISVGGATGLAASIQGIPAFPTLGTQRNLNNVRTSTAIEAYVLDDANQPVPAPSNANLQVAIVSGGAASGARLLAGSKSGSVLQVSTTGGVGLFSLSSGASEGSILLEMTADRFDNDVSNGIQDPVTQLLSVAVTAGNAPGAPVVPLALGDAKPPAGTNGLPYSYAFSATGGVAPYAWTALGVLPEGLSLSSSGILSGTPAVKLTGTVNVAVRATDSQGSSITGNFPLAIAATPTAADPSTTPLSINLSGCGSDVNAACSLTLANPTTPAPVPTPAFYYQYVLSVTGSGTGNAAWVITQKPTWLNLDGDGILSITSADAASAPALQDCTSGAFFIRATRGGATTLRKVQLVIGSGAGTCKP